MKKILLGLSLLFFFSCTPKVLPSTAATIDMVIGKVTMTRNGKVTSLKKGQVIRVNDVVKTDTKSLAVIRFHNNDAYAEVQSNSEFSISSYLDNFKEVYVNKGNVWFKVVKKMKKNETIQLKTRTYVAAVRGTKFYNFHLGDYEGTCHCEGSVSFKNLSGKYNEIHKKDFLTFTKGNKTIVLLPQELEPIFGKDPEHKHSEVTNSKLGKLAAQLPEDKQKLLMILVAKKFKTAI